MTRRSLLAALTISALSFLPAAFAGGPARVITNADLPAKPKLSVVGTLRVDGPREMPKLDAIDVMNPPAPPRAPEPADCGRTYERRGLWGVPYGWWSPWYGSGHHPGNHPGRPGHGRRVQVRPAIDGPLPMPMPIWPSFGGYPQHGPSGPVPTEIRGRSIPTHAPGSWPSSD